jgi:hypothetical protein
MKKKHQSFWLTDTGLLEAIFGLTTLAAAFLSLSYNILQYALLSGSKAKTKAVIINEANAFSNNTRLFSYFYQFYQHGHAYTGNSLNSKYQVGDSVWIKYVPAFPRFNRITEPGK